MVSNSPAGRNVTGPKWTERAILNRSSPGLFWKTLDFPASCSGMAVAISFTMSAIFRCRNRIKDMLIVDDEVTFLETVAAGLASALPMVNVVTASNGKKALEMVKTAALDLVITDLRMPEMNGFELLEHLSERKPPVAVIVMSVANDIEARRRLAGLGVRAFLEKPFDFQTLLDLLVDRRGPGAAARTVPAASRPAKGRHILVMDDDPTVRTVTRLMLEERGHAVCLSSSGEEAVGRFIEAQASGDPFDLVLLDLKVHDGMGGVEASRLIRVRDPRAKIILATGAVDDPVFRNPADYGFAFALAKPYATAQLDAAIRRIDHARLIAGVNEGRDAQEGTGREGSLR